MPRVRDPDFGTIDAPSRPTREQFEKLAREIDERARDRRMWPRGSVSSCPTCGKRRFVGRDDLSWEVPRPGGVVVFRRLRGARCEACGAQSLEPEDLVQVEAEAGPATIGDYEAKVSNIGSGTVGTYWPKDVVRVLGLTPDTKAYIAVLDRETILVRFRRERTGSGRKRRRASASAGKVASKARRRGEREGQA